MKIIEIDSQILNSIHLCATRHKFEFEENLTLPTKAAPLEKGSLLHKVLEMYDGLVGNCVDMTGDTWVEIADEEISRDFFRKLAPTRRDIIDYCIKAGQIFASKMEIDNETSDNVIFQFNAYCEYYANDPWMTLAVEQVASRIMFEHEDVKIVYTGKIDRLVERGPIIAPMDHKSSDRRGNVSSLSNQFIGYCFLIGVNNIIVDKIGFQKTLSTSERFQRFNLTIDDARINEWRENTINTILNHLLLYTSDDDYSELYFHLLRSRLKSPLMNLTSCDKWSGCIYNHICEGNPEGRSWTKERDYISREAWDVGKILEAQ